MTDDSEPATGGLVPGPGPGNPPLFQDFDRCGFGRYLPGAVLPPGTIITINFNSEPADWTTLLASPSLHCRPERQEDCKGG